MAKPTPRFYVFHGTDEFTRAETLADFKRRLGPPDVVSLNTVELDGRNLKLPDLRDACDTLPFLAERRLIIVYGLLTRLTARDEQGTSAAQKSVQKSAQKEYLTQLVAYLPRLPETTRLVFVEDGPLPARHPLLRLIEEDTGALGYAKEFAPPQERDLPAWIGKRAQKHGGRIEPQAAQHLATLVGAQLRLLDQEILKLVTYTGGERPITKADVDTLTPYVQTAIVFDMVDALGRRDGRAASQTLHRLLDTGEHPLGLLTMIVRQFRLLLQVKELKAQGLSAQEAAQALKLHPFPTGKLYQQEIHFTAGQLEAIFRRLLETDIAIKTGELDAEVALDLLVAGLAAT